VHIAGPAGLIADLGAAFAGIDGLLLIVALSAVLLNLLVVYRAVAPPFVVLFTSISALTLAGGIVYLLARNDVLTLNGQSQGIWFTWWPVRPEPTRHQLAAGGSCQVTADSFRGG